MRFTNIYNLPEAIVKAVTNDPYDKGDCDFSVTELIKPSRVWALEKQHKDDLVEDVSNRLWSLYGQLAHDILERANDADLAEKRFFADFSGNKVSGQIDTLSMIDGALSDYKFTTAWAFMTNRSAKPEWEAQLNMQLEILRRNNIDAEKLQIIGLLRDFQVSKAGSGSYPPCQIMIMPIEIWDRDKTTKYIESRIRSHKSALLMGLPECSDEDRWRGWDSKTKKTVFRRCENYCVVKDFCEQYKQGEANEI